MANAPQNVQPAFSLDRVEDEAGNADVTITLNDDAFFAVFGNGLNRQNLRFYVSDAKDGPEIAGVKITTEGPAAARRAKLAATASHVDKGYLDTPLWLVGIVDATTFASLQVVTITK